MSVELSKIDAKGKSAGNVDGNDAVFGIEPNVHVLNLAVRRELANGRAETAKAKTRSEVRGGGRKPFKQKGTGRARAGSIRSPLWVGGGVIFGPTPNVNYSLKLPKKVRALAIRSALSAAKTKIRVVENFSFLKAPKTKDFQAFLTGQGITTEKVLLLADYKLDENQNLKLASRNIPNVTLRLPTNLSVKDIIGADVIILGQVAVNEINERYGNND